MPGASLRERLDVTKTLEKFRQTRGRPQFTTRQDKGLSSGLFSQYPHSLNEHVPSRSRSHSAANTPRSASGAPDGVTPASRGRSRERSSSMQPSSLHDKPFRTPSQNPGLFDPKLTGLSDVTPMQRSASASSRLQYSRSSSAAHQRSSSTASRQSTSRVHHEDPSTAGNDTADTSMAPLSALLARGISTKKSRADRQAEHENKNIKRSLNVRYQLVSELDAAKSSNKVHRVPHDGLKVEYYDRGRKMTTAQLYAETAKENEEKKKKEQEAQQRSEVQQQAASPTRDSLRYGPGMSAMLWNGIVSFCDDDQKKKLAQVNRAVGACALTSEAGTDGDDSPQTKLWRDLREANVKVRAIPATFFEALRQLGRDAVPPTRTLFALHMAALIIDDAMPPAGTSDHHAIWLGLQPHLQKDDPQELLSQRLVSNPMGAVDRDRVTSIRYAVAEMEQSVADEARLADQNNPASSNGMGYSLVSAIAAQSPHGASIMEYAMAFVAVYNEAMK